MKAVVYIVARKSRDSKTKAAVYGTPREGATRLVVNFISQRQDMTADEALAFAVRGAFNVSDTRPVQLVGFTAATVEKVAEPVAPPKSAPVKFTSPPKSAPVKAPPPPKSAPVKAPPAPKSAPVKAPPAPKSAASAELTEAEAKGRRWYGLTVHYHQNGNRNEQRFTAGEVSAAYHVANELASRPDIYGVYVAGLSAIGYGVIHRPLAFRSNAA